MCLLLLIEGALVDVTTALNDAGRNAGDRRPRCLPLLRLADILVGPWRSSSVVEQGTHKPLVGGSNPPSATTSPATAVRPLLKAPDSHPDGHRRPDTDPPPIPCGPLAP